MVSSLLSSPCSISDALMHIFNFSQFRQHCHWPDMKWLFSGCYLYHRYLGAVSIPRFLSLKMISVQFNPVLHFSPPFFFIGDIIYFFQNFLFAPCSSDISRMVSWIRFPVPSVAKVMWEAFTSAPFAKLMAVIKVGSGGVIQFRRPSAVAALQFHHCWSLDLGMWQEKQCVIRLCLLCLTWQQWRLFNFWVKCTVSHCDVYAIFFFAFYFFINFISQLHVLKFEWFVVLMT